MFLTSTERLFFGQLVTKSCCCQLVPTDNYCCQSVSSLVVVSQYQTGLLLSTSTKRLYCCQPVPKGCYKSKTKRYCCQPIPEGYTVVTECQKVYTVNQCQKVIVVVTGMNLFCCQYPKTAIFHQYEETIICCQYRPDINVMVD